MAKLLELEVAYMNMLEDPSCENIEAYQAAIKSATREYSFKQVRDVLAEMEAKAENDRWVGNPA